MKSKVVFAKLLPSPSVSTTPADLSSQISCLADLEARQAAELPSTCPPRAAEMGHDRRDRFAALHKDLESAWRQKQAHCRRIQA